MRTIGGLSIAIVMLAVGCGPTQGSAAEGPDDSGTTPSEVAPTEEETGLPALDTGSVAPTVRDTDVEDTNGTLDAMPIESGTDAKTPEVGGECDLPPRDCDGTATYCGALVPFEPVKGVGYDNYPINGETATNQYRSYARRDLMMLVKYAAAFVECKAKGWTPGNGKPIGLGDMSEKSGAIPGTSIGSPAHPTGSHTNGYDMDIAYFQTTSSDNILRSICPHATSTGADAYHCTGAPTILDVRRTALFLGAFLTSPRTRVIGVDGKVGPLVMPVIAELCTAGTLPKEACAAKSKIAYEPTDTGKGWYQFHHHHLHVSLSKITASGDWHGPPDTTMPSFVDDLSP